MYIYIYMYKRRGGGITEMIRKTRTHIFEVVGKSQVKHYIIHVYMSIHLGQRRSRTLSHEQRTQ